MTTLTVYDPAMCGSTGICGTEVDRKLVDLAADLDWLKAQGAHLRRIILSQEPAEFVANAAIRALMQESEGDDLPAFLVDGRLVAKACYPSRADLANWAGVADTLIPEESAAPGDTDAPKGDAASAGGCCGGARPEPAKEKTGNCC